MRDLQQLPEPRRIDQMLRADAGRSGTVVQIGDEQAILSTIASVDQQLGAVNGVLQKFQLGRVQRKTAVAKHRIIAAGELDVLRATVSAQAKAVVAVMDAVAKAQAFQTLALLKSYIADRVRRIKEQAHLELQRSLLRLAVQFADHTEVVMNAKLPADLQDRLLKKSAEIFNSEWEEIAAVELKV